MTQARPAPSTRAERERCEDRVLGRRLDAHPRADVRDGVEVPDDLHCHDAAAGRDVNEGERRHHRDVAPPRPRW